jgi:hypothetical protein
MRLIIAGSRTVTDYSVLQEAMEYNNLNKVISPITEIVSGAARGADYLGELYAIKNKLKINVFPALWDTFGKSAGYKRNVVMADNADGLVALWDGISRGTKHMVDIAIAKKIPVLLVHVNIGLKQSVDRIITV